jgi:hypothetical protein
MTVTFDKCLMQSHLLVYLQLQFIPKIGITLINVTTFYQPKHSGNFHLKLCAMLKAAFAISHSLNCCPRRSLKGIRTFAKTRKSSVVSPTAESRTLRIKSSSTNSYIFVSDISLVIYKYIYTTRYRMRHVLYL